MARDLRLNEIFTFPSMKVEDIRHELTIETKEDVDALDYELAYAVKHAFDSKGMDLHPEYEGGDIVLHKSSQETLVEMKIYIAGSLKINMEQGWKRVAMDMLGPDCTGPEDGDGEPEVGDGEPPSKKSKP